MSTFKVEIVKIPKVFTHPNAETLSIVDIFEQTVVFKTGSFKEGDLAVYVPAEAVVPLNHEAFAFLDKKDGKTTFRIKPVRLRGVYSEGLLIPAKYVVGHQGSDVADQLGVKKYEEPVAPPKLRAERLIKDPGISPRYDMESLLRFPNAFRPDEPVVVTEKIHGCNARYMYHKGQLWVGSHNVWRGAPKQKSVIRGVLGALRAMLRLKPNVMERVRTAYQQQSRASTPDPWWKAAKDLDLETKLAKHPGITLYGEIYGQVQDLKYGVSESEVVRFAAFDAYDASTNQYLTYDEFKAFCLALGVPMTPVLYDGCPLNFEAIKSLRTGKSTIDDSTIREGVVIRARGGARRVFKLVSEEYKLRKGGTEFH